MLTEEQVLRVMSKTMHPEIDYSLVDLGMIKQIGLEPETVNVTLNLPFPGIPIKDHLVKIVKDGIAEEDQAAEVRVSFAVMNEAEREEFRRKARDKWKL